MKDGAELILHHDMVLVAAEPAGILLGVKRTLVSIRCSANTVSGVSGSSFVSRMNRIASSC